MTVWYHRLLFYMIGIYFCSYMEVCFEFAIDFRVQVSTFMYRHMKEHNKYLLLKEVNYHSSC